MTNYSVFQINALTEFRLSEALEAMRNKEDTLWLNQKSDKPKNRLLGLTDVVYLWESGVPKPRHLVARGKVVHPETLGKDVNMPAWQQAFCVGGHKPTPRAEIKIDSWLATTKRVDRIRTSGDRILRQCSFLNSASGHFRGITIVDLTEQEARALDQLAGW
jgi:hypothetical protein